MATENTEPTAETETQTPKAEACTAKPEGKADSVCAKKCGKCRKGLVAAVVVAVAAGGAFAVPEVREAALEKYAELTAEMPQETVEETVVEETNAEDENISIRLEQLENAREFEEAETVVATSEPQPADPSPALADMQKIICSCCRIFKLFVPNWFPHRRNKTAVCRN